MYDVLFWFGVVSIFSCVSTLCVLCIFSDDINYEDEEYTYYPISDETVPLLYSDSETYSQNSLVTIDLELNV